METNAINLGLGILTGLAPFLGWLWLCPVRSNPAGRDADTPSAGRTSNGVTGIKRFLVFSLAILQISLLGLFLYLVISPAWFNLFIFVLGTLIAQAVMISFLWYRKV